MTMSDLAPAEENQPASVAPFRWTNWVGNQSFVPEGMASPQTEASVVDAVRAAAKGGHAIRASGSGHSFTPIVETSGTLLNLDALQGVISVDADRRDVTAWSQTRISAFGDALWDHGLALSNQGDIDPRLRQVAWQFLFDIEGHSHCGWSWRCP
jgi:FAD/FMN-containing dehydrogenase